MIHRMMAVAVMVALSLSAADAQAFNLFKRRGGSHTHTTPTTPVTPAMPCPCDVVSEVPSGAVIVSETPVVETMKTAETEPAKPTVPTAPTAPTKPTALTAEEKTMLDDLVKARKYEPAVEKQVRAFFTDLKTTGERKAYVKEEMAGVEPAVAELTADEKKMIDELVKVRKYSAETEKEVRAYYSTLKTGEERKAYIKEEMEVK